MTERFAFIAIGLLALAKHRLGVNISVLQIQLKIADLNNIICDDYPNSADLIWCQSHIGRDLKHEGIDRFDDNRIRTGRFLGEDWQRYI